MGKTILKQDSWSTFSDMYVLTQHFRQSKHIIILQTIQTDQLAFMRHGFRIPVGAMLALWTPNLRGKLRQSGTSSTPT